MLKRTLCLFSAFFILVSVSQVHAERDTMVKRLIHATSILRGFNVYGRPLPYKIFNNAKGIAILDIGKGGFLLSGKGGRGIVVMRTPNGWSAPSAISISSIGLGFQLGYETAKTVLLLNNDLAVEAFSDYRNDKISLGADVTIVAGPQHEAAKYETISPADVYVYQMTNGAFFGLAVSGTSLSTDTDVNYQFYGERIPPPDLLSDKMTPPPEAQEFYDTLSDLGLSPEAKKVASVSSASSSRKKGSHGLKKHYYYGTPSVEAPAEEQDQIISLSPSVPPPTPTPPRKAQPKAPDETIEEYANPPESPDSPFPAND